MILLLGFFLLQYFEDEDEAIEVEGTSPSNLEINKSENEESPQASGISNPRKIAGNKSFLDSPLVRKALMAMAFFSIALFLLIFLLKNKGAQGPEDSLFDKNTSLNKISSLNENQIKDKKNSKSSQWVKEFNRAVEYWDKKQSQAALDIIYRVYTQSYEEVWKVRCRHFMTMLHADLSNRRYKKGEIDQSLKHLKEAISYFPANEMLKRHRIPGMPFSKKQLESVLERRHREKEKQANLSASKSANFAISYASDQQGGEDISQLIAYLEACHQELSRRFNTKIQHPIKVVIYPSNLFSEILATPHWVGAIFDGAIKIPSKGSIMLNRGIENHLYHELTHAFIFRKVGHNFPTWLNEGLAQMLEPGKKIDNRNVLRELKRNKQLLSLKTLSNPNWVKNFNARDARIAYLQAHSMTLYLEELYQISRKPEFFEKLAKGKTFEEVFENEFQSSSENFFRDWLNQL